MDVDLHHPQLAALYSYWRLKAETHELPRRRDIDPIDLRSCLGHLALVEVERPFRLRYRLFGTKLAALYGADLTGCYLDQLFTPRLRAQVVARYRHVVETARPHYEQPSFRFFRRTLGYHRLLLPLTSDGSGVDLVLTGLYPSDPEIENAYQWRSIPEIAPWLAGEVKINSAS